MSEAMEAPEKEEWVGPIPEEDDESLYGIYLQRGYATFHYADAETPEDCAYIVDRLNQRDQLVEAALAMLAWLQSSDLTSVPGEGTEYSVVTDLRAAVKNEEVA